MVGSRESSESIGFDDGAFVGSHEGSCVGSTLGLMVGSIEGNGSIGCDVGELVGTNEGAIGSCVGMMVG